MKETSRETWRSEVKSRENNQMTILSLLSIAISKVYCHYLYQIFLYFFSSFCILSSSLYFHRLFAWMNNNTLKYNELKIMNDILLIHLRFFYRILSLHPYLFYAVSFLLFSMSGKVSRIINKLILLFKELLNHIPEIDNNYCHFFLFRKENDRISLN